MSPTMRQLAADLGVNAATVSRALDPAKVHLVAPATRDRVLAAVSAAGYTPHPAAAGLRRRTTNSVGIVVPDLDNHSIVRVVRAITASLDEQDFVGLVAESMDDPDRTARLLEQLKARRVDATISLAATKCDRESLTALARSMPVVLAVRRLDSVPLTSVSCDDRAGGRLMAQHLLALGHGALGQVRGPRTVAAFADRSRGFVETSRASRVKVHSVDAVHATVKDGRHAAELLFARADVTAVFAHNDDLALGVLQFLKERGMECPAHVSVAGYNDTFLGGHITPALTTVRWPAAEVGRCAAELALAAIAASAPGVPESVTFSPELIVRASTHSANGDGRQADVQLDRQFNVVTSKTDREDWG